MEPNQHSYAGKEVLIRTIDGMAIEGTVIQDTQLDYLVVIATNLAIKGEFKLNRNEIYRIEIKGKELKPPD